MPLEQATFIVGFLFGGMYCMFLFGVLAPIISILFSVFDTHSKKLKKCRRFLRQKFAISARVIFDDGPFPRFGIIQCKCSVEQLEAILPEIRHELGFEQVTLATGGKYPLLILPRPPRAQKVMGLTKQPA